jgi:hypothetical protein
MTKQRNTSLHGGGDVPREMLVDHLNEPLLVLYIMSKFPPTELHDEWCRCDGGGGGSCTRPHLLRLRRHVKGASQREGIITAYVHFPALATNHAPCTDHRHRSRAAPAMPQQQQPGRANLAALLANVWACLVDVLLFWQLVSFLARN